MWCSAVNNVGIYAKKNALRGGLPEQASRAAQVYVISGLYGYKLLLWCLAETTGGL